MAPPRAKSRSDPSSSVRSRSTLSPSSGRPAVASRSRSDFFCSVSSSRMRMSNWWAAGGPDATVAGVAVTSDMSWTPPAVEVATDAGVAATRVDEAGPAPPRSWAMAPDVAVSSPAVLTDRRVVVAGVAADMRPANRRPKAAEPTVSSPPRPLSTVAGVGATPAAGPSVGSSIRSAADVAVWSPAVDAVTAVAGVSITAARRAVSGVAAAEPAADEATLRAPGVCAKRSAMAPTSHVSSPREPDDWRRFAARSSSGRLSTDSRPRMSSALMAPRSAVLSLSVSAPPSLAGEPAAWSDGVASSAATAPNAAVSSVDATLSRRPAVEGVDTVAGAATGVGVGAGGGNGAAGIGGMASRASRRDTLARRAREREARAPPAVVERDGRSAGHTLALRRARRPRTRAGLGRGAMARRSIVVAAAASSSSSLSLSLLCTSSFATSRASAAALASASSCS